MTVHEAPLLSPSVPFEPPSILRHRRCSPQSETMTEVLSPRCDLVWFTHDELLLCCLDRSHHGLHHTRKQVQCMIALV